MSTNDAAGSGTAGRYSQTAGGKKVWGVGDQGDDAVLSVEGANDDDFTCTTRYQYVIVTAVDESLGSLDLTL